MSGDSENPDDLIFDDDERFPPGSAAEGAGGQSDKEEGEVVFGDEAGRDGGDEPPFPDSPDAGDQLEDTEMPEEDSDVHPGDIAAALGREAASPQRRAADQSGEDRVLFGDQTVEPSETFSQPGEPFAETGAGWEGHFLPADQIGIPTGEADEGTDPVESDPLTSDLDQEFDLVTEEQELQLVDDESELDAGGADPESWLVGAGDEGALVDAGTEEGWVLDDADPDAEPAGAQLELGRPGGEEPGEYVLDEGEPEVAAGIGFAETQADVSGEFVLDESDLVLAPNEEEVDPEWAPVASAATLDEDDSFVLQDDPVYGSVDEQEEEEEDVPVPAEPEYAEYAESYLGGGDAFADGPEPEAAELRPAPGLRLLRVLSGVAAASILIAAGLIILLRPELLGLKVDPTLVDRVQIARPQLDLGLEIPRVELPDPVAPDPVTPDPVTPDPVVPDPVTPDPVVVDPVTPDPVVPDPVTPDPVTPDPMVPDPVVTPDPVIADPGPTVRDRQPLQLGETGLAIGDQASSGDQPILDIGVSVGSQAFAQLHNGNFFIGMVKRVTEPEDVTLTVPNGEVTLALADLRTLAPLGSMEYRALQEADQGYVRLVNNSLLRGTILRHNRDDNVILQMRSNQVLIPQSDIEEVGSGQPTSVQVDDSGDMDWVRRLVEEGMGDEAELPETGERVPSVRVKIDR